jgi:2-haloacid dehalogenase
MKAIVFDLGNVLVRWDPVQAFLPDLGSRDAAEAFMARIDFFAKNLRADSGTPFAEMEREIDDPADRAIFAAYLPRVAATIREAIEGSWLVLERLRARGYQIHAVTNWSAEAWPIGTATHPRLGSSFGVTVVSGQEGIVKPDPRIFALLCDRAGLAPADCLFIDDSPKNVESARAFGMQAEQFITPDALETALVARGLL